MTATTERPSDKSNHSHLLENAYSFAEEVANSVSHGIGAVLSIAGLTLLVAMSLTLDDGWRLASSIVYGSSLTLLFMASTLYHGVSSPKAKGWLQVLDHCAIYLLIAGTYTPFLLINLRGAWGWSLFAVIWSLALFGIFFKVFFRDRFPRASLFTYILMGWLVIVAIFEMIAKVPTGALVLLFAGGIVYTLGTVFYAIEKIPYNHAIWHLFVLGGSVCHFLAIYLYVIPKA